MKNIIIIFLIVFILFLLYFIFIIKLFLYNFARYLLLNNFAFLIYVIYKKRELFNNEKLKSYYNKSNISII